MKRTFSQVVGSVVAIAGLSALAVMPGVSQAGEVGIPEKPHLPSKCEVTILPVPGPEHCEPVKPPVTILPVPDNPPVSTLPVDRVGDLRLWIVRRGEGFRSVIIPCGPRCPLGLYLLGASRPPVSRNCHPRQGTVRAGGIWQGRQIGSFHNRSTCRASQWRKVAPIYNRLLP